MIALLVVAALDTTSATPMEPAPPVEAPPAAVVAPTVTFHQVAQFSGRFPYREPWSPTGHVLVYGDDGGLHALDLDRVDRGARLLAARRVECIDWSPDGGWLVGRQDAGPGRDILLAVPVFGSGEIEVAIGNYRQVFWGSDGKLYFWDDQELHSLESPAQWRQENPQPFPLVDHYVVGRPYGRAQSWAARVRTYPDRFEVSWIPAPSPEVQRLYVRDEFDSGRGLLLWVTARAGHSYYVVTDAEGQVRTEFPKCLDALALDRRMATFTPWSVSSDGRYVAGFTEDEPDEFTVHAEVFLADIGGRWIVPIQGAPEGLHPDLSREGLFLAFEGVGDGTIRVGSLEIVGPK